MAELRAMVRERQAHLKELQARLKQDSANSSLPPSPNPPQGRKPMQKEKKGMQAGRAAGSCRSSAGAVATRTPAGGGRVAEYLDTHGK
jgi:transposase